MEIQIGIDNVRDANLFMRACNHFHTARKYDAQVTDVVELGESEPTGQEGEYILPIRIRDSRLEAAGQVGAAHAEITGTLYMSALEVASKIGGPEPAICPRCGQQRNLNPFARPVKLLRLPDPNGFSIAEPSGICRVLYEKGFEGYRDLNCQIRVGTAMILKSRWGVTDKAAISVVSLVQMA